jgi:hypothetical protein
MGLVQKKLPVTQGGFRILVYREHDRLDVLEAVTFPRPQAPDIGECLDPGRIFRAGVVPFHYASHSRIRTEEEQKGKPPGLGVPPEEHPAIAIGPSQRGGS